jgi:hypothetical protein
VIGEEEVIYSNPGTERDQTSYNYQHPEELYKDSPKPNPNTQTPIDIPEQYVEPGIEQEYIPNYHDYQEFIICPHCGEKNLLGSQFCKSCFISIIYPPFRPEAGYYDHHPEPEPAPRPEPNEYYFEPKSQECPHCGTENDMVNEFCENCYRSLTIDHPEPKPTRRPMEQDNEDGYNVEIRDVGMVRCPHCGEPVRAKQKECYNCGERFTQFHRSRI